MVNFDDMLGARNCSQRDDFFTRGKHENLVVYYINQSYFGLPRRSIRNNSDRIILLKQSLKDVQGMYFDIGAYDMKNDELKEMCSFVWSERINHQCIVMTKNKNESKYRTFNKSRNTYIECFCKTEAFLNFLYVVSN